MWDEIIIEVLQNSTYMRVNESGNGPLSLSDKYRVMLCYAMLC